MSERIKKLTLINEQTGVEDCYALSLNVIGEGKYAKVYKATHMKNPNNIFAVKVISIINEEVKKEYLKELKIIKNLPKCPNLVQTHKQHLESENNLYIFQQYCESGTLINYRAEKMGSPFTEEEIYDLFFQTCNGMICMLEAGIVHQDIKPVNILRKGKRFKLCDFGVSEIQSECKETTTRKGTISYMPPQKLKSKNFLPNEKSDIFSLGTCLYEIIFGYHPYIKKKTTNYKEYLQALEESKLRPISILMKRVASSSLRLENFLLFFEKMIYLNEKKRASLAELKEFLTSCQPFKSMKIPDEDPPEELIKRESFGENFTNLHESMIVFRRKEEDDDMIYEKAEKGQFWKKSSQKWKKKSSEQNDPLKLKKQLIQKKYQEQVVFVNAAIGYLLRGIQYIRKSNLNNMNVNSVENTFVKTQLNQCCISRFLKFAIYNFCLKIFARFKEKYINYLNEEQSERLIKDYEHLSNQFRKYSIQCSFEGREQLAEQLSDVEFVLSVGSEVAKYLQGVYLSTDFIKIKNKDFILGLLYCKRISEMIKCLESLKSIFKDEQIFLGSLYELNDTSIEIGMKLVEQSSEFSQMKLEELKEVIELEMEGTHEDVILDIEDISNEYEIIGLEDE